VSVFQFLSVSVNGDVDDLKLALPTNSVSLSLLGSCTVLASVSFTLFVLCWLLDHPEEPWF